MPVTTSRILPKALALVAPFLLFALTCGVAPGSAYAQREHRVRSGQTLSQIARRYRVTVSSLAGANHLQLRSTIRPGRVLRVPDPGEIFVMRGQSLSQIARQHHTTVQALIRTNRLSASSVLTAGQRLMVPGAERRQTRQWGRPRTPGVVTLVRGGTSERIRIR
ncbi:MAG: LysM domain-containing protein, partial [Myxococcota bacterium]